MEANYRENCNFTFDRIGETWTVTGCWKLSYDNTVAWWDAETIRGGIKFYRIFKPTEVVPTE